MMEDQTMAQLRKVLFLILILILIIFHLEFVDAKVDLENNPAQQRYQKILNELNKTEWVQVIIGVTSKEVREDIISSLSKEEFKFESKSLLGKSFSGKITKQGIKKLVNNSDIRWINLKETLSTQNNETSSKYYNSEDKLNYVYLFLLIIIVMIILYFILRLYKNKKDKTKPIIIVIIVILVIVLIINSIYAEMLTSEVGVKYDSQILDEFARIKNNQTVNKTLVNMIIDLKNISEADNLLSSFSKDEIWLIKKSTISSRISARITKKGFDKLIQDDRVDKVYYDFPFHASENKFFNKRTIYLLEVWAIIIVLLIILIYFLIKKIKEKKIFKKMNLIFLILIILEIIFLILTFIFLTRSCGNPCNTYSPLDPFGYSGKKVECVSITMCLPSVHPITFIIADLLVLTIVTYIIFLITNKMGIKK